MKLMTMKQVTERVPFHRVHIYRLMNEGKFPRPIKLSTNRIAFVASEIDDWIVSKMEARNAA